MRIFRCDHCNEVVPFEAPECPACHVPIGYDSEHRALRMLVPTDDPVVFTIDDRRRWRCLNAAWGCNWVLPVDSPTPWCRSCRITRGRPDEDRPSAVEAWMAAEAAKRRLVHQLDELSLPIEIRSEAGSSGLAFDLVWLPGEGGITGHLDGVVTLDLSETDEAHREAMRRRLGEPFRTVIGHLRHEVGHHYWGRLVGQTDHLDEFRALFGDERVDYRASIDRYYAEGPERHRPTEFVTDYAASHPLEDWAETFAHYLHIMDTIDTAVAHDLVPRDGDVRMVTDPTTTPDFQRLLEVWRPVNAAATALAETVGARPPYPFDPTGAVVDKLAFVHGRIVAQRERDQFSAVR